MKKYIQILVVVALALAVIGIARANPAWAGALINSPKSDVQSGLDQINASIAQPMSIIVTGSGSYLIGGVCQFETTYTATDLKNQVDAEVPVADSKQVPFGGTGHLYYPGCHVVHYKADQIVDQAKSEDGNWKVCFAKRPDVSLTVYYYLDNPPSGTPAWSALPTTVEGDYSCAPALYTGVYMPAGDVISNDGGFNTISGVPIKPAPGPGTVIIPNFPNVISKSGSYGMGGICALEVFYKVENLSDNLWEEFPVEDNLIVTFPDNGDVLFFPGCHVLHYELSEVQKLMGIEKGEWKICFAAAPGKTMTIYYYESMVHADEHGSITPPWTALPTTTENGLACAPAQNTGVYVPAGQ
jgi:hypothetical protein